MTSGVVLLKMYSGQMTGRFVSGVDGLPFKSQSVSLVVSITIVWWSTLIGEVAHVLHIQIHQVTININEMISSSIRHFMRP